MIVKNNKNILLISSSGKKGGGPRHISILVDNLFKDFKTLSIKKESFKQTIDIKKNFQFILDKTINNSEWKDIFFNKEINYFN